MINRGWGGIPRILLGPEKSLTTDSTAKDDSDDEGEEIVIVVVTFTIFRFVSTGRTVVCVGRNYAEHARELGRIIVFISFSEFWSSLEMSLSHWIPPDQGTVCLQNHCSS